MTTAPEYVVGAIRLALEGAADTETALGMVRWLVDQAAPTDGKGTASVDLFIEGIRTLGYSVQASSPAGLDG